MAVNVVLFLLIFVILVVIGSLTKKGFARKGVPEGRAVDGPGEAEERNEWEDAFCAQVREGAPSFKFLKIANPMDLMLLKSLLQAEDIPYYAEFEKMARLYPGMFLTDFGNSVVYILEKDYPDALELVVHYLETKTGAQKHPEQLHTLRHVAEIAFVGWAVPSSAEMFGITVFLKER